MRGLLFSLMGIIAFAASSPAAHAVDLTCEAICYVGTKPEYRCLIDGKKNPVADKKMREILAEGQLKPGFAVRLLGSSPKPEMCEWRVEKDPAWGIALKYLPVVGPVRGQITATRNRPGEWWAIHVEAAPSPPRFLPIPDSGPTR